MKSRGVSKYIFISSTITPFSRSICSSSKRALRIMSTRTSSATSRCSAAQPEWLAQVPTDRHFPDGTRLLFTGCGTSFHAAMTGGEAVQALELVLNPEREGDLLVLVSHEGETPLTLEAARAWHGPRWLVTGRADGPIAELCGEVVVRTPGIE